MFDKFNEMVKNVSGQHGIVHPEHCSVSEHISLLQTAAMLILAEEIHTLTTTASALAQATANLGTTINQLNSDFNTAWPVIQAALQNPGGTPQADIDAAVSAMNGVSTQLSTMDTDFKSVVPATTTPAP